MDKGKAALHKSLSDRVMKGRMKGAERDTLLEKITPSADYASLKDCDLIIEAVFEDRKVKSDVIARIQAVIGDNAIFASNTSTLPITSLAAEFKDPKRFIGVHFFSPVAVMMLTEVILGKETGDRHPKIRRGVLIGAGAKILGNIEVGHCARVAAGSVVLKSVPHNMTVAGVPARVVGEAGCPEPSRSMDQMLLDVVSNNS